MSVAGRKPKPAGTTVHRNPLVHDWTEVDNVPFVDGPKLPARRMNGRLWSRRDRQSWKALSTMPHCKLWGPAAWEFAFDTMELAALMHEGDAKVAAEVRARHKVLGTTMDARTGQRIRYIDPPAANSGAPATVTRIEDFRDL